jgi:hypothetical protein
VRLRIRVSLAVSLAAADVPIVWNANGNGTMWAIAYGLAGVVLGVAAWLRGRD